MAILENWWYLQKKKKTITKYPLYFKRFVNNGLGIFIGIQNDIFRLVNEFTSLWESIAIGKWSIGLWTFSSKKIHFFLFSQFSVFLTAVDMTFILLKVTTLEIAIGTNLSGGTYFLWGSNHVFIMFYGIYIDKHHKYRLSVTNRYLRVIKPHPVPQSCSY